MSRPRFELRTACVLDRSDNQLHHRPDRRIGSIYIQILYLHVIMVIIDEIFGYRRVGHKLFFDHQHVQLSVELWDLRVQCPVLDAGSVALQDTYQCHLPHSF